MKHLFIINPVAKKVKNKVDKIKAEIEQFFLQYPDIHYEIYVSSWCRDSVSYIRSYITKMRSYSEETVRVHAIGGTGTLFEVVNGVYGLSNVEVAAHPYGTANAFIRYFGRNAFLHFKSLKNMVFDGTFRVDLIRCENNYGICFGAVGLEALGDLKGDAYIDKKLPADFSYMLSGAVLILTDKNLKHKYTVEIDGQRHDGEYISFLIANTPCYATGLCPAPNAHPDDGKLEIFMIKNTSRLKMLLSIPKYTRGEYESIEEVCHYTGEKINLTTTDAVCINIDGESFFATNVEFEIVKNALSVVCPNEIDIDGLPAFFTKPIKGTKKEARDVQQ